MLLRKLIIDDLTINGIQLGSLRDVKGHVYRRPIKALNLAEDIFADVKELLSVDEILAKSPLKTTKAIENTQAIFAKHSEVLQQQYAALPEKK